MAVFENDTQKQEELQLEQLAAARAALDPSRREQRLDVLMNTAIAVLAGRGPLSEAHLLGAVQRVWGTSAITAPLLRRALEEARGAGLVTIELGLDTIERFAVTPPAKTETAQDLEWASRALDHFESQVKERLFEYDDDRPLKKTRAVVNHVIAALGAAAADVYRMQRVGAQPMLRPVELKIDRVHAYAQSIEPPSLRDPVEDLALDALDPDDPFGNEIVHLVVVGNLLHGIVAQRGFGTRPSLDGSRILLDTSSLVPLVSADAQERRLIEELIAYSVKLGVDVHVAEHTLEEWERVWVGATAELRGKRADDLDRLGSSLLSRLSQNPFVAAYLDARAVAPDEPPAWDEWQRSRRNMRPLLESMGVIVRPDGNTSDLDLRRVSDVAERLREYTADGTVRGRRTHAAADADARSCAMVASRVLKKSV